MLNLDKPKGKPWRINSDGKKPDLKFTFGRVGSTQLK